MPASIELSPQDRQRFRDILNVLDLRQKDLVIEGSSYSLSWVSQMLSGARIDVDLDRLREMTEVLKARLDGGEREERVAKETAESAQAFLEGFLPGVTTRHSRPGMVMAPGDPDYVTRDFDEKLLATLDDFPSVAGVRGPVQSGKTSQLKMLESKALERGFETLWFDPDPSGLVSAGAMNWNEDASAAMVSELCAALQFAWKVPSPPVAITTPALLYQWLYGAMDTRNGRRRLLIIDDLGSLGPIAASRWLLALMLPVSRVRNELKLSVAFGMSFPYSRETPLLIEQSSHPMFAQLPGLSWLSARGAPRGSQHGAWLECLKDDGEVFQALGGQPYLTHAAVQDAQFRAAVQVWQANKTADSAKTLREHVCYKRHLRRIRHALVGPATPPDKCGDGIAAFSAPGKADGLSTRYLIDMFLVDQTGKYKAAIYCLMAEDLTAPTKAGAR